MALDLSGPTAPPRTSRAVQAEHKKLSGKMAARKEAAQGVAQLAGFGLIVTKQYADAGAIGLHADPVINELVALSDTNERVGKALDYLTEAGPYAGLVIATLPLVLQIMANHNMVKAELVAGSGVVPPQMLESQVRADMARQAAGALRAQHDAEAELAAMAAQMRTGNGSEGSPEPSKGKSGTRAGT